MAVLLIYKKEIIFDYLLFIVELKKIEKASKTYIIYKILNMKIKTGFICMLISLTLFGCQTRAQRKNKGQNIVYIDLPQKGESLCKASSFADTVIYIPLETTKKSLLRNIRKLVLTDSLIIVTDYFRILVFHRADGRFIRQIGTQGKGPGTYNSLIFDFTLKEGIIYISSAGTNNIIKFDINGDFLGKIKQNRQISKFESIPGGGFASYDELFELLILYDHNFHATKTVDFKKHVSKKLSYYTVGSGERSLFTACDRLLLTTYLSDTIWEVTSVGIKPFIVTNLKDKLLPANMQVKYMNGDFEKFSKIGANYQKLYVYPVSSYIIFLQQSWESKKHPNALFVYSYSTKKTKRYKSPFICDDIVGGGKFYPFYTNDNLIISWTYPYYLKSFINDGCVIIRDGRKIESCTHFSPDKTFVNQVDKMKIDDNPVIILIKTKK